MRPRVRPTRSRTAIGPPKVGAKVVAKIRRTKEVAYTVTWEQVSAAIIKRDRGQCVECGSTNKLNAHHIISVASGGRTVPFNLKTLCHRCHSRKHSHMH